MYAIIATGGKQFKVEVDDVINVELLGAEAGEKVEFNEVLACGEGSDLTVGSPMVDGAKVSAEVVDNIKGKKLVAFKMKKRKGYRKKKGHRQKMTQIKITSIDV